VIILTEAEQRLARYLAQERPRRNRAAGVKDQLSGGDAEAVELDGVGAELAFCRLMNVYPDLSTEPRRGGGDCVVNGVPVDVKTTRYNNGQLIVKEKVPKHHATVYALMVGRFPEYDYRGCALARDVLRPERLTKLGDGKVYAVSQDDLVPWDGMIDAVLDVRLKGAFVGAVRNAWKLAWVRMMACESRAANRLVMPNHDPASSMGRIDGWD